MVSQLISFTSETSRPDSIMLEGMKSTPSTCDRMASSGLIGRSCTTFVIRSVSVTGRSSGRGCPRAMVREAYGSVSTSSTRLPSFARPMPRFLQVVVFPVPPFWLATAMIVADILCASFAGKFATVQRITTEHIFPQLVGTTGKLTNAVLKIRVEIQTTRTAAGLISGQIPLCGFCHSLKVAKTIVVFSHLQHLLSVLCFLLR